MSRFSFLSQRYSSLLAGAYVAITGLTGFGAYSWKYPISASSDCAAESVQKIDKIRDAFLQSKPLESEEMCKNICGRIKCMRPVDDLSSTLSHPIKPFSWVFGSDGLYSLSQCIDHYQMCMRLGFEKDWIERQLLRGNTFNLYLFPEFSEHYTAVCATWSGIFQLLEAEEPEIYAKIKLFRSELIHTSFEDIESKSDFEFLDVAHRGPGDDRYLTKERFLNINDEDLTLVDCRLFLYCYMGLRRFYDGDGYTVDKEGKRGCKEYLIKNMRLNEIAGLRTVPLNVKISL